MNVGEIELAIARYFDTRQHLIVPNVYWGLGFSHELDLLILTKNNYVWEIEIKTSKSDLKADLKKKHGHYDTRIKRLYFAVPAILKEDALQLIPDRAGLLIVDENGIVSCIKQSKINLRAVKITDKEAKHLYFLVAMRMWNLKEKLYSLQKSIRKEENDHDKIKGLEF